MHLNRRPELGIVGVGAKRNPMELKATVARSGFSGLEYLAAGGKTITWTSDEHRAACFSGIREATRMALTLPGKFRAFAFPMAENTYEQTPDAN
jgi:hypothetical protein